MNETSAHARFRLWFASLGCTQSELARRLVVDPGVVSRLLAGTRSPGLAVATAIERESADWRRGPILAGEWVDGA